MADWQPIETAPKIHKAYVVLWLDISKQPVAAYWDGETEDWWRADGVDIVWADEPTYWMSLEPPKESE